EHVQELLRTADDATIESILGAMADGLPPHMRGGGYNFRFSSALDNSWNGQLSARMMTGNDIVVGNWSIGDNDYYTGQDVTNENSASNPSWWHRAFVMTTAANRVFNVITENLIAENESIKLRDYLGRAYITRAFGYLYAQKTFGTKELGMSIYTEYDLSQPLQPRSSALETLDAIIEWATRADELFAEAGVGFKAN